MNRSSEDNTEQEPVNFNDHHPELLEGEIFLGNYDQYQNGGCGDMRRGKVVHAVALNPAVLSCETLRQRWSTLRVGNIPYDNNGKRLTECHLTKLVPVFVQRAEYEANKDRR